MDSRKEYESWESSMPPFGALSCWTAWQARQPEIDKKDEQIKLLREHLKAASEEIADWGAYASDYFQEKHDLKGTVDKYHSLSIEAIKGDE